MIYDYIIFHLNAPFLSLFFLKISGKSKQKEKPKFILPVTSRHAVVDHSQIGHTNLFNYVKFKY